MIKVIGKSGLDYLEGYHLAIANSKDLNRVAILAAGEGKYGVGCALNILAAEEVVKGIGCCVRHFDPIEPDDLDAIFKDHKVKHSSLKQVVQLVDNLRSIEVSDLLLSQTKLLVEAKYFIDTHPGISRKEFRSKYPILPFDEVLKMGDKARVLIESYEIGQKLKEDTSVIGDIISWLSDANTEKNDGLYVGINGNHWKSPDSFDSKRFERENLYVISILEYNSNLEKLLMSYFKYKSSFQ